MYLQSVKTYVELLSMQSNELTVTLLLESSSEQRSSRNPNNLDDEFYHRLGAAQVKT